MCHVRGLTTFQDPPGLSQFSGRHCQFALGSEAGFVGILAEESLEGVRSGDIVASVGMVWY